MASRTQLRLEQLTGSFDATSGINDQIAASATGSINASSLQDILSHMAGAIKRVHGYDSFAENVAGVFSGSVGTLDLSNADGGTSTIQIKYGDGAPLLLARTDSDLIELRTQADGAQKLQINSSQVKILNADLIPATDSASSLGTTGLRWSDLYTDAATVGGNLTVGGNATVTGNLTVSGDMNYQYVTSSIVEFNDPMLVTNAIDTTSNAGLQITSASFAHAVAEIEAQGSAENSFDYGVIWKRSLGYDEGLGAYVDGSESAPSLFPGLVEAGTPDDVYDVLTDGYPFAVFDASSVSNAVNDTQINITLNNINRSNVRSSDLLNAMKGAYVVVSGSNAKKLGLVTGQNAGAVQVRILGSGDSYGDISQTGDTLNAADITAVHLLNAYAGTIFDKKTSTFHMAAGAITGSGDNNFISGSANILQYGSVSLGKLSLFSNDVVSGSSEVLNAEYLNTDGEVKLQSANSNVLHIKGAGSGNGLILSSSAALKLVANDRHLILPSTFTYSADQSLKVNANGEIVAFTPAVAAAADANEAKAVMKVKSGVTITAGINNLILTGAAGSQHFEQIGNLAANLGDQSAFSAADRFKKLEVYVNGQLLTSGTHVAGAIPTGGDYAIMSTAAGNDSQHLSGAFAFNLEADDIVTLIRKL